MLIITSKKKQDENVLGSEVKFYLDTETLTDLRGHPISKVGIIQKPFPGNSVNSAYYNGNLSNQITATSDDFIIGLNDYTIECVVAADPDVMNDAGVFGIWNGSAANTWALFLARYNGKFYFAENGAVSVSPMSFSTNVEYRAAICRKNNILALVVNNTVIQTLTARNNIQVNSLMIGGYYGSDNYKWKGYVRDVSLSIGIAKYL